MAPNESVYWIYRQLNGASATTQEWKWNQAAPARQQVLQRELNHLRLPAIDNPAGAAQAAGYNLACAFSGWPLENIRDKTPDHGEPIVATVRERMDFSQANVNVVRSFVWRGNSAHDIDKANLDIKLRACVASALIDIVKDEPGYIPYVTEAAVFLLAGATNCLLTAVVDIALRAQRKIVHDDDDYVLMADKGGDHAYVEIQNPRFPTVVEDPWGENSAMLKHHFQSGVWGHLDQIQQAERFNCRAAKAYFGGLANEVIRIGRDFADDFQRLSTGTPYARIWPMQPKYAESFATWIPSRIDKTRMTRQTAELLEMPHHSTFDALEVIPTASTAWRLSPNGTGLLGTLTSSLARAQQARLGAPAQFLRDGLKREATRIACEGAAGLNGTLNPILTRLRQAKLGTPAHFLFAGMSGLAGNRSSEGEESKGPGDEWITRQRTVQDAADKQAEVDAESGIDRLYSAVHEVGLEIRAVGEVRVERSGLFARPLNVSDATSIAPDIVKLARNLTMQPQNPDYPHRKIQPFNEAGARAIAARILALRDD